MLARQNPVGFSLLEVMISVIMITLIAVGFIGSHAYAKRSSVVLQQRLTAIQLIEKKLSLIKTTNGDNVANTQEAISALINGGMSTSVQVLEGDPRLKSITVTVGWDFPWRNDEGTSCLSRAALGTPCDRTETASSIFFSE